MINTDEDVIMISSDGVVIRISAGDISTFARPAKGVRVMRVDEGARLVTVSRAAAETESDDGNTDAAAQGEPQ